MAFKIAPKAEIKTKVVVEMLGDLGKTEKFDFVMTFRKHPTDIVSSNLDDIKSGDLDENELIKQDCLNWEGVKTDDGTDADFNVDNLESLFAIVEARKAIANAYWSTQAGAATRKN